MKICYFGEYRPKYSRNSILIKGLLKNKQIVIPCNHEIQIFLTTFTKIIKNILIGFTDLFCKHSKIDYDAIILGYPINISIWLANLIKKKPLIIDPFISRYNSIVYDIKLYSPDSIVSRLVRIYEKKFFNSGHYILSDTKAHAKYFSKVFHIPLDKFKVVYLGADDEIYFPREKNKHEDFIVGFYGTYLPVQGIEYIIESAEILKRYSEIKFELIGGNPSNNYFRKIIKMAKSKNLENIKFIQQIPEKKLPFYIQKSDIQLGIFGDSIKTKIVIPNKVYTAIAMKKPVLTANTIAIKEVFKDRYDCLLCNIADAEDLSNKILELYNNKDLYRNLGDHGYKTYIENFKPEILGKKLINVIQSINHN